MRKLLLAVVALGGLTALSATGAVAQPYEHRGEMGRPMMHQVEHDRGDRGHHQWHHRRWEHGHWRYWD
jgi:hypothetical protein